MKRILILALAVVVAMTSCQREVLQKRKPVHEYLGTWHTATDLTFNSITDKYVVTVDYGPNADYYIEFKAVNYHFSVRSQAILGSYSAGKDTCKAYIDIYDGSDGSNWMGIYFQKKHQGSYVYKK